MSFMKNSLMIGLFHSFYPVVNFTMYIDYVSIWLPPFADGMLYWAYFLFLVLVHFYLGTFSWMQSRYVSYLSYICEWLC